VAKLILDDVASLQSESSAIQTLNQNSARIETALENTLSRDGTTPNQMEANLDLNDFRIMNLAAPVSGSDAARLIDITNSLVLTDVVVPSLEADKLLTNDGDVLVWAAVADIPGLGDLRSENNLDDVLSASTARTNLGLGTAATQNTGTSGANLGLLNTNLTFSGNNIFLGTTTYSESVLLSGTADHRIVSTPTTIQEDSIGYRGLPSNTKDQDYTMVLLDSGKMILHTSASTHAWTIPPNASVAYPIGTVIGLVNVGSGAVTVTRGASVVLRMSGTATDQDRAIAQHGVASILKTGTNSWYISGSGVS
jgi:hypothetical protein